MFKEKGILAVRLEVVPLAVYASSVLKCECWGAVGRQSLVWEELAVGGAWCGKGRAWEGLGVGVAVRGRGLV